MGPVFTLLFDLHTRQLEREMSNKTVVLECIFICTNISIFNSLEVVGRGSETHLQVGENFKKRVKPVFSISM